MKKKVYFWTEYYLIKNSQILLFIFKWFNNTLWNAVGIHIYPKNDWIDLWPLDMTLTSDLVPKFIKDRLNYSQAHISQKKIEYTNQHWNYTTKIWGVVIRNYIAGLIKELDLKLTF